MEEEQLNYNEEIFFFKSIIESLILLKHGTGLNVSIRKKLSNVRGYEKFIYKDV